ncbi:hypothetical protein EDC94DRAFT_580417 [Helicostylum pulchrum]|nr:hypothetical protein EDC94DRAFT_580417 [Helicostylum pulchrum]
MCMRVFYPEEQKFKFLEEWLICNSWGIYSVVNSSGDHMVCASYLTKSTTSSNIRENTRREADGREQISRTVENFKNQYAYPDAIQPLCTGLNYRELSILSPIKLMTQIKRKGALSTGRIGHYEVKGSVFTTHNYEFAEMAYAGVLGLFFQKGEIAGINKHSVKQAYAALQNTHPLLGGYSLQELTNSLVSYHVTHNRDYVDVCEGFRNNMLNPHSEATGHEFADLIIGSDVGRHAVWYGHLYTTCTGHYSMCSVTPELEDVEE